jgi:hypothetical protein
MTSDEEILIGSETNDSIICLESSNETAPTGWSQRTSETKFKMLFEETIIEDETPSANKDPQRFDDDSIDSNKENDEVAQNVLEETVFSDGKKSIQSEHSNEAPNQAKNCEQSVYFI